MESACEANNVRSASTAQHIGSQCMSAMWLTLVYLFFLHACMRNSDDVLWLLTQSNCSHQRMKNLLKSRPVTCALHIDRPNVNLRAASKCATLITALSEFEPSGLASNDTQANGVFGYSQMYTISSNHVLQYIVYLYMPYTSSISQHHIQIEA